jgi:hypothetical protein
METKNEFQTLKIENTSESVTGSFYQSSTQELNVTETNLNLENRTFGIGVLSSSEGSSKYSKSIISVYILITFSIIASSVVFISLLYRRKKYSKNMS